MSGRRSFDKNYLEHEFDKLSSVLKQPLTLYLIGGGAMSFYGVKDATKDIDIILTSQNDLNELTTALHTLNYAEPNPLIITRPYNEMQTSALLENPEGFRWDIFLNRVCGGLTLSTNMKNRAASLYQASLLTVYRASKEDLFLFKSITSREADLDDTAILARSGLNWEIITQECQSQSEVTGICWEDGLYQTIRGLREKYGISAPMEKTARTAAEHRLMEKMLIAQISSGNNTIIGIAKKTQTPRRNISAELYRMTKKGLVIIDKSKRPYTFALPNPPQ